MATSPAALVASLAGPEPDRLEALRRMPEGETRRAAATALEVTFLAQLLGALRRTVPENDFLPRSPDRQIYEGMFDRAVAEALAVRDPLGLVRALGEGD